MLLKTFAVEGGVGSPAEGVEVAGVGVVVVEPPEIVASMVWLP
jgi:hypothetical protein